MYKKCPYCAEEILAEAKKCKHCGEYLDATLRSEPPSQDSIPPEQKIVVEQQRGCYSNGLMAALGTLIVVLIFVILIAVSGL